MNEWIDFSVYAAFMVVFWFIFPTRNSQWETLMLADRNPGWLTAHPEVNRKLAASRWHRLGGYVFGTLSLAALLAAQLELWPRSAGLSSDDPAKWNQLWDIMTTSLLIGLLYFVGRFAFAAIKWGRRIPLAERRQAEFTRRSLDGFIPARFRLSTYGLVCAHAVAWVTVGLLDLHSSADYWQQAGSLVGLSVLFSVLFSLIARLTVNRRPNAMDRMLGPDYRSKEVRFAFIPQLLPPLVGALRLVQEVSGTGVIETTRTLGLGMTLLIILGFLKGIDINSSLRQAPMSAMPRRPGSPTRSC